MIVKGLVLSGGESKRMLRDKGSLIYYGVDQRTRCFNLLSTVCKEVYVSCREDQADLLRPTHPPIFDSVAQMGPATGMLSAHRFSPETTWMVLACDLPLITFPSVRHLLDHRDPRKHATAYLRPNNLGLEPLFAIWEPSGLQALEAEVQLQNFSPRRVLQKLDCRRVQPIDSKILTNINTPDEYIQAVRAIVSVNPYRRKKIQIFK